MYEHRMQMKQDESTYQVSPVSELPGQVLSQSETSSAKRDITPVAVIIPVGIKRIETYHKTDCNRSEQLVGVASTQRCHS